MSRKEFVKQQLEKHPEENRINIELPSWVNVGSNVHIADSVHFNPRGFGYEKMSNRDEYTHIPHSGKVVLEDNVEILEGTNIVRATADDGETRIRYGSKIDYNVHIAHNVKIGKNCLVIAGTIIGGSVEIGDNCYLGIGCMIKNKVKIGNNVTIGMGAVVLRDVSDNSTVIGNPAKQLNIFK